MKTVEPVSCILCHCKKTKPYEQMCTSACEYLAMSEWAKSVWLETKPSLPIVSHTDFCYSTTATLFSTKWGIKRYHADILWYLQYEKVFFQKHLIPLCSFGSSLCGKKLSSELFPLWLVVFVARVQGEIQVRYTKRAPVLQAWGDILQLNLLPHLSWSTLFGIHYADINQPFFSVYMIKDGILRLSVRTKIIKPHI